MMRRWRAIYDNSVATVNRFRKTHVADAPRINGEAGDFARGVTAELELRAGNNREPVAYRRRKRALHAIAVNHNQLAFLDAHSVGRIQLFAVIASREFVQLPHARLEGFGPLKRLRFAIVAR